VLAHALALALAIALAHGQDSPAALREGEELLRAGRLPEAEARLEQAVAIAPELSRAQYYLGVVRMRLGRPGDAVAPLEKARELATRDNPAVLFELGNAYVKLERYEEAAAVLSRASAAAPNDATFRLQLGYAYYKLLEGERAEAEFETVLSSEPGNALARFYLGLSQSGLGKLSDAERSFRLALDSSPELVEARLALARTLSQENRDADARAELERVLAESPRGSAPALSAENELGLVSLRASDFEGARRHFEAVVAGRPQDRQAVYNLWLIYRRQGLESQANAMKERFEALKEETTDLRSLARTSAKKNRS
jgi:protein O-GlcNAc transferase